MSAFKKATEGKLLINFDLLKELVKVGRGEGIEDALTRLRPRETCTGQKLRHETGRDSASPRELVLRNVSLAQPAQKRLLAKPIIELYEGASGKKLLPDASKEGELGQS